MKIIELLNAPNVVITNEEQEVLDLISMVETVKKTQLDPRQLLLVDSLVKKDILIRKVSNGTVSYKISSRV